MSFSFWSLSECRETIKKPKAESPIETLTNTSNISSSLISASTGILIHSLARNIFTSVQSSASFNTIYNSFAAVEENISSRDNNKNLSDVHNLKPTTHNQNKESFSNESFKETDIDQPLNDQDYKEINGTHQYNSSDHQPNQTNATDVQNLSGFNQNIFARHYTNDNTQGPDELQNNESSNVDNIKLEECTSLEQTKNNNIDNGVNENTTSNDVNHEHQNIHHKEVNQEALLADTLVVNNDTNDNEINTHMNPNNENSNNHQTIDHSQSNQQSIHTSNLCSHPYVNNSFADIHSVLTNTSSNINNDNSLDNNCDIDQNCNPNVDSHNSNHDATDINLGYINNHDPSNIDHSHTTLVQLNSNDVPISNSQLNQDYLSTAQLLNNQSVVGIPNAEDLPYHGLTAGTYCWSPADGSIPDRVIAPGVSVVHDTFSTDGQDPIYYNNNYCVGDMHRTLLHGV